MRHAAATRALPEPQFAALVDALAADPARRDELTGLLREEHSLYDQRGAATVVRMRGWVLLALARAGVSDAALIFVLEEFETGLDPYLVAAAARALRSYPIPERDVRSVRHARARTNIRYHDEPISFESYGEYAVAATGTSPVRELLATLAWLGPHAAGVLDELRSLRAPGGGLPRKLWIDIDRAIHAITVRSGPISPRRMRAAERRKTPWSAPRRGRRRPAVPARRSSRPFSRITTARRSLSGNSSRDSRPSSPSSIPAATIR